MNGVIFDIKEFTVHDGPGSRVTVFLKGCPLRCVWCHNPEGLSKNKQLMYKEKLCIHCGACLQPCEHPECKPFGRCVHACANGCLSIVGEDVSADDLAERLLKYKDILNNMGGGITISGGEPLLQAEFVCRLTEKLTGIHKALQTSGYASPDVYQQLVSRFDFIMQDIKLADNDHHIKYTGVANDNILKNIEWLKKSGKDFVFRVPLIPGITDTEENLKAIGEITAGHRTELMPYNELAGAKYPMVGMQFSLKEMKNRNADHAGFFKNARILR